MSERSRFLSLSGVEPSARELLLLCWQQPVVALHLARKLWRCYLSSLLGADLPGGSADFTRFLIIGRYRSGSNLVRGSLMSHSRVVALGDVFRAFDAIKIGLPFYPQTRRSLLLFQRQPAAFLEQRVFGRYPRSVDAVGFKLLYPNAGNRNWQVIRQLLASHKNLRVIHVKRKNVLRAHLSMRLRLRDGQWKNVVGSEERHAPILLTPDECRDAFISTRNWEDEHDELFREHPLIDVFYEDLCNDYEQQARRMQDFLGIAPERLRPLTHKQSSAPLSNSIANYDELKSEFRGSEWQQFFED